MKELLVRQYLHNDGSGLTWGYDKSEADKVIAEKDKEIARLDDLAHAHNIELLCKENLIEEKDKKIDLYKRGWEESDKINASIYAELRHQKYKRCLAMAEKCDARYDEEDAKVNGHAASWEHISKEMKYWERWRNRWLAIAEKFKEVQ